MKKIVLLVFLALLTPKNTLAQYRLQNIVELNSFKSIPKEKVFIHYNDNLLLTGEYLYYKFYCRNSKNRTPSKVSKIGYVELIGTDGKSIFRHKIQLADGLGEGDFFVPITINTGHYKLVGYTQWMQNEGEKSFFIGDLAIINPYQELPKTTHESSNEVLAHSKSDSLVGFSISEEKTKSFKIKLPQKTFEKRQLIKFGLQEITEQGVSNLSISVRKKDSITLPFQKKNSATIETNTISGKKGELKLDDSIYLPELRGEMISGHLVSKTSKQPATNENISLSIAGDNGLTKVSRSNANGAFYFNLDTGYRNKQVIFDILGDDDNEIEIILDSLGINPNSFNFMEMAFSPDLNPIFEQRSIYNQIENAFFEQKADSTITTTYNLPAYKDFQEVYNLDDYTRFPTLRETIVEIIEDVLVKKRKDQFVVQIRGNDEFFIDSDDTPLILVDNVLVQNTANLFDYDVKKIQRIGISRNDYYIGAKKYQGIFSIETKDSDYLSQVNSKRSSIQIVSGPIPTKKYYVQDYSKSLSKSTKHNADFRQQLLWLPKVIIDKLATFEFYSSDNIGTYEISIEGFTTNGKPISISEKIYVE